MFSTPTLIKKDANFSVYINSMTLPALNLRFANAYEFLSSTQAFPLLALYVSRITVIIVLWHNISFVCGISFWGSFICMQAVELHLLLYSSPYFKCTKNLSILLLLDIGIVYSSLLLRIWFTHIYFMRWMGINETEGVHLSSYAMSLQLTFQWQWMTTSSAPHLSQPFHCHS